MNLEPLRLWLLLLQLYLVSDHDLWYDEVQRPRPRKKKRIWVRDWIYERHDSPCNTYFKLQKQLADLKDEYEYRSMMRMSEDEFLELVDLLYPHIEPKPIHLRRIVHTDERLSVTLTYLAYGGTLAALSRMYRLGRSTILEILDGTCPALYNVLKDKYLAIPRTEDQWKEVVAGYETRWNFPNCIGALDGKHIRVQAPGKSGSTFYNYKGYFSMVLMAMVDANYNFLYVDVGAEGRMSDGGLWRDCDLHKFIKDGSLHLPPNKPWPCAEGRGSHPHVIVADDAFAMSTYLLKPYCSRNLDHKQRLFNYRLSRARRVVENAFGIMSCRFRLLHTCIHRKPEKVVGIVLAITALHNFLRRNSAASYLGKGAVDQEDANHRVIDGEWRYEPTLRSLAPTRTRNYPLSAKALRDEMAEYFSSPEGKVPWQEKAIAI